MTNSIKNKKKRFLLHFDHIAGVWIFNNKVEDTPLQQLL